MEGDAYALMRQIANGPGTHFGLGGFDQQGLKLD
jgi:hypothetical protein